MAEIFTTPDCDFKPNNWEVHAFNHIKCGVKSLTIYKDDKDYNYFRVENLGELFNVKYKGLKDTSDFARVIFENTIIVMCKEDVGYPDEHYCRVELLEDISDELVPIFGENYTDLIQTLKSYGHVQNERTYGSVPDLAKINQTAEDIKTKSFALGELLKLDLNSFSTRSRSFFLDLISSLNLDLHDAAKSLTSLIDGGSENE